MNWSTALKIAGPSALAAWMFYFLMSDYLRASQIFRDNLALNILFVVVIFFFCSFMGWLWVRGQRKKSAGISGLEVNENEVGGGLNVGAGQSLLDSKVNKNKVNGDLNVGGKQ